MSIKSLSTDWNDLLSGEFEKEYFKKLKTDVNNAYQTEKVYPPASLVFNAFRLCSLNNVKIVIIGQDPYHGPGQAHGLCFSVNNNVPQPPSLRNIFKELEEDIEGFKAPASGNLEKWASQGVLLLNAVLTVKESSPGSHKSFGWETFTDAVISLISGKRENLVFMLWGNFAASKKTLIDHSKHLVLTAAHPSPLARGAFFGCRHFSKANQYLVINGKAPVNWLL